MSSVRQNPAVVVIGAGMTGMAVVIKLKAAGIHNITLLEKGDSVGGTWRENRYPAVGCDVPAHAYTYSFETNPDWSNFFADGNEIHEYFKKVYVKYGVDKHTRLNEGVTSCVYQNQKWTVKTTKGNVFEADLLFAATGMLHKPNYPAIPGLESFAGASMHSARWDPAVDMTGKRIGVIGTGSSAAQLIPALIDTQGTQVTVFQRTAQWLVDAPNHAYHPQDKARFRNKPWRIQLVRFLSLGVYAQATAALVADDWWASFMHRIFAWNGRRYLNKSIKDPELRAKLTPDYKFGCKRVVMNSTFYPAIQKPNARLVTQGIDRIEADGVVTKDGELHKLDVLVLATGFDPAAYMRPMEFRGRNGLSIEDAWSKKIQAYRSLLIPEFPNFFLMLGPNSPIGNYSVIAMSEMQTDYCIALIKLWQQNVLQEIEVKPQALEAWRAMLREKMQHTVWSSGCSSWYLDADGDPLTWPDKWKVWASMMRDVDTRDLMGN